MAKLPFLVEDNPGAVSIIGMASLRQLEVSSSRGFRHLFLSLKEDTTPIGQPCQGESYPGNITPSCNINQELTLDIRVPDLASYSGCLILNECHPKYSKSDPEDIQKLNGRIIHIQNGFAQFQPNFPEWRINNMEYLCRGTPVPCSHQSPGNEGELAFSDISLIDAPVHAAEQQREQEQDLHLLNTLYTSNALNQFTEPEDPDDLKAHDLDIIHNDTFNIEVHVPKKPDFVERENVLEIKIIDQKGLCYLCMDNQCTCFPNRIMCGSCSPCNCSKDTDLSLVLPQKRKDESRIFLKGKFLYLVAPNISVGCAK